MIEPEDLSDEDIALLNSKFGQKQLFLSKNVNIERVLRWTKYENTLRELQVELIKLQTWVINNNQKVVILFEGRDAAGKGGAIRRITAHMNPRNFKVIALPKPSKDEKGQWYFQRYVNQLPNPGHITFFDRSWYNRAIVEPVNGFCTDEEYDTFLSQVNHFEKMLGDSGIHLIKFYFSITKDEQATRFEEMRKSPLKRLEEEAKRVHDWENALDTEVYYEIIPNEEENESGE